MIPALRNAIAEEPAPEVMKAEMKLPQPRNYLLFFDINSSELGEQSNNDVARAARFANSLDKMRIIVRGHTDSVGNPEANKVLSQKRANVVAAALRIRGVPRDAISATASGESELAISTSDGVEEINNRRVEIVVVPRG